MKQTRRVRLRSAGLLLVGNVAVGLTLLFVVEGFASGVYFAREAFFSPVVKEREHTEYDEELGWINLPDLRIQDMYGPGVSLSTNSQRFRIAVDAQERPVPRQIRLVCAGDSFTLGFGVGDSDTWCHRLTQINERIESVNLRQGGYGFDQAYLWYKRNSAALDHEIQVFGFITADFERMRSSTFLGYGKPLLELHGGALVNVN
ncbi:MAG TPA: hypothetical protein EYQ83_19660 [Acidobacteria bacterium]|nr:hypothetical protein [Acidobacteriota bacterium]